MDITPVTDRVRPIEVNPGEFKTFEAAVKKFRKLIEKDGRLQEVRERERGFVKKSQKRHNKKRRVIHMRKYNKCDTSKRS
ncbi:MAG: 30S ribosomal protein S21 [Candidatus Thorarchaeota archaeon]